jgi:hypothetical protein
MLLGLRIWLFAITILLLAEDFQYLLKSHTPFPQQLTSIEITDYETDNEDNEEGKKENEEKTEKKEKDDDNNNWPEILAFHVLGTAFRGINCTPSPLLSVAGDLESPPPEN